MEVFDGRQTSTLELAKNSNSYTPLWGLRVPNVAVHKSTVAITLKDSDTFSSQNMARIILDEQLMLAIEEAGGTVALDTRTETGGAVYRLFLRVSP